MSEFVHLHLHTDYSLLDGASAISWSKIKDKEVRKTKTDIIGMAKLYHSPAVAMTDHGVMGGAVDFYHELHDAGIKPIIGCEMYVAPNSRFEKDPTVHNIRGYHLILLAQNTEGYVNLCKIVSEAHLHGYYYKPRTDKEFLAAHSKGLIALNACLQGEIPVAILEKGVDGAKKVLSQYLDIFGKDNFYLEVMYHGIPEQKTVNQGIVKLSKEFGVPIVATNDVHYLKKEHARAQDIILCIQTRSLLSDENRMRMNESEFYYKSPEEMEAIFGTEIPEACPNTLKVAERCNFAFDFKQNHYPVYKVGEGERQIDMLKGLCLKGCPKRYGFDLEHPDDAHKEEAVLIRTRMEYELSIIEKTKYPSYFLVVWDFINAAKKMGVPVGPGRGSGAGSLVAFLVGITDIDPIRFKLFFERFLNPERVSPPDFDIDFCERRRGEVIEYVTKKYGVDCVAQIATYGTLKAKQALKDVARVLGRTPSDGDRMTKLLPNDPKLTLASGYRDFKEFSSFIDSNEWAKQVYQDALPIEGLNRNPGIHAAGVIIGDQRLDNVVPLMRGAHDEVVVQYVAHPCEELGLLKMDFLGLRTLTVIDDAVQNIRKNRRIPFRIEDISLEDKPTYDLLNKGDTVAVFQLESGGMQNLCRQFVVENIYHLIALIAIYRPGPMEFIPTFVARKKGEEPIIYDHPKMEPILKETYGIMLYQEQIMEVVQKLAGFTLGHADIVRRAIGKKKLDVMEKEKQNFIKGCAEVNNIPQSLAEQIWEKINKFAGYGFNKSHSAAYGLLSYRTAFLKANYPQEFMAAVLTSELDKSDKVAFLINACRQSGIPVLPPDINKSDTNFTVDGKSVRFGLGGIKGLGSVASDAIISSREKDGPYKDVVDMLERTGSAVNSKALDSLIRAGAFDFAGTKRSQMLATINESFQLAATRRKDKESGQGSLFDMLGGGNEFNTIAYPDIPEIDKDVMLQDEKALLGFYISGHPAEKYADIIESYSTADSLELQNLEPDAGIRIGGILKSVSVKISKKSNKPFVIFQLENLTGSVECAAFDRTYEGAKALFKDGTPVFVTGTVRRNSDQDPASISARSVIPLEDIMSTSTAALHLHIFESECTGETLPKLRELLLRHHGTIPVVLCVSTLASTVAFIEIGSKYYIKPSLALLQDLRALLGEKRFKIKGNLDLPPARKRWVPQNDSPQPIETVN